MRIGWKAMIVRLTILGVVVLSGCGPAARINLTGIWTGQITWTSGPASGFTSPITLDLFHEDDRITGTVTLMGPASQTFDIEITSGRARNRTIEIHAAGMNTLVTPPVAVSLDLDGDYSETGMSGTGTETIGGTVYQLTWEIVLTWSPPSETSSSRWLRP